LLTLMLLLSSIIFIGSSNAANAAGSAVSKPQVRIEVGPQRLYGGRGWHRARGNRIAYGRTFTRDVQRGWRLYRETYQVRYLPNGYTQTVLVSRVRLN
jgi:hypothetical protein